MNKKAIFIIAMIILFVVVFAIFYTIGTKNKPDDDMNNTSILDNQNNETEGNNVTIEVVSSEEKTTPNTVLVLKKFYQDCGHTITNEAQIPEELVNLTTEEIQKQYPNWEVEEFSKEEVVLFKVLDSFCGEHYLLTEEDGYINIYIVDEEGNKSLKQEKVMSVEYLSETDKIMLKNGLMVYGTNELNKILEDYE